ncbi:TetR family transcriptional regulator [Zhengella sp. ZM62]|uniref:TetR family transcriptional regulator n=1 Tax=Zhengella sedimenti TaxID=3390035 RepID=UPI003975FF4C
MPKLSNERMKIRDEVAALKRERTLGAAADLFYERGYENTTLDDVAKHLGVTKPFIYANIGSKSDLLAKICEVGVGRSLEVIRDVLKKGMGPVESLEEFAPRYVATILSSQKSIAIYIREEKNLEPKDAARLAELRRQFVGEIERLLRAGIDSGAFRISDSRLSALALIGAVSWSTFWYRPDGKKSLEEIASGLSDFIVGLVRSEPASA